MGERPTQSRKRGQGGNSPPLRGQGAELPCGVWGNAPTVFRALNSKEAPNKGAGSEASLPVTLRIRRCAPQLALPTPRTLSRQMGATEYQSFPIILILWKCRDFATVEATRSLSLAPRPLRRALPCFLFFLLLAFSCGRRIRTVGRSGASAQSLLPSKSCQRALSGASPLTFCR